MTLISLGTRCNARSHIKLSIRCSFCVPKSDLWLLLPPALRPPLLPPPTLRRHVQAQAPASASLSPTVGVTSVQPQPNSGALRQTLRARLFSEAGRSLRQHYAIERSPFY